MCKITVDASNIPTLFVLSNNTNLGTTFNHYRVGQDLIQVDQGKTITFDIYNGNNNLTTYPLAYGYGYKSALRLTATTGGALAASLALSIGWNL